MRGWTRQPPAGTPIDWANPIARKLIACALANTPLPHDSVTGRAYTASGGNPSWGINSGGGCWNAGVGSSVLSAAASGIPKEMVMVASGLPGSYGSTIVREATNHFYLGTTGSNPCHAVWSVPYDSSYDGGGSAGTIALTAGLHVIGATFVQGSCFQWVDGVEDGSWVNAVYVTGPALNFEPMAAEPGGALVHASMLFGELLTPAERLSLSENPWQLFAPRRRRVYALAGSGGTTWDVSLAESASAADSTSAILVAAGALGESASAADTLSELATLLGSVSEAASATDTVSTGSIVAGSLSESGAAADTVSGALSAAAALSEAGVAVDTVAAVLAAVSALSEAAAASDALAAAWSGAAAVAESGSVADAVTAALSALTALSEAGAAADTVSWSGGVYSVSVAETAAATDSIGAALLAVSAMAEAASAADTVSAQAALVSALTEAAAALDSLSAYQALMVVIAEAADAEDVLAWVSGASPGAERIVVLPYGKRIAVVAFERRIAVAPHDPRITVN